METGDSENMKITVNDYFDLDKIIESGQTFRARKLDDNMYRFISLNHVLYISKVCDNSYDVSCSKDEWDTYWYNYFDLDRCYKDIIIEDEFARKCFNCSKGIRILRQEPFEMLISFIISQRKSIPAIRSSIEEICTRFGDEIKTDTGEKVYLFPTPAQLVSDTKNKLDECKLGYRLSYIKDAVQTVYNSTFLEEGYSMNNEQLLEHLMSVKGVGIKVANCIALFAYNRIDLAPVDTWINKIINTKYKGKSPFDTYKAVSGIIQQYFFYYAITHKDEF